MFLQNVCTYQIIRRQNPGDLSTSTIHLLQGVQLNTDTSHRPSDVETCCQIKNITLNGCVDGNIVLYKISNQHEANTTLVKAGVGNNFLQLSDRLHI